MPGVPGVVPSVYCIRGDFRNDDGHFLKRLAAIEEWHEAQACDGTWALTLFGLPLDLFSQVLDEVGCVLRFRFGRVLDNVWKGVQEDPGRAVFALPMVPAIWP